MPSRTTSMTTIAATHLLPNQPTALIIITMSGRSNTAFMHAVIIDEVEDGDDRSGDRSDDRSEHLQPSFTTSSRPGSWSSSRAPPIRPCSIVPPGQHGQHGQHDHRCSSSSTSSSGHLSGQRGMQYAGSFASARESGDLYGEPRLFSDVIVELGESFPTLVSELRSEVPLGANIHDDSVAGRRRKYPNSGIQAATAASTLGNVDPANLCMEL